jgi:hypothetical protein
MFEDTFEHFVEKFLGLASDAGHVVEYVSEVIAESGGSEPRGHGSSSGDGKECADEKRLEERFDLRFEFVVESVGDALENFEGGLLSLLIHGSSFSDRVCLQIEFVVFKQSYTLKDDSL